LRPSSFCPPPVSPSPPPSPPRPPSARPSLAIDGWWRAAFAAGHPG
jgi:hypothetical protein